MPKPSVLARFSFSFIIDSNGMKAFSCSGSNELKSFRSATCSSVFSEPRRPRHQAPVNGKSRRGMPPWLLLGGLLVAFVVFSTFGRAGDRFARLAAALGL